MRTRSPPYSGIPRSRKPGKVLSKDPAPSSRRAAAASATRSRTSTSGGEEALQRLVEESPAARRGTNALPVALDQAFTLEARERRLDRLGGEPCALGEQGCGKT